MDQKKRAELSQRYHAAAHGVQSAIAFQLERTPRSAAATPKHLRVGLNMCLVDASAIAKLLIAKGVITEEEYLVAIAEAAEDELARITAQVQSETGLEMITFR